MFTIEFLTLNVFKKTLILGNAFYGTPGTYCPFQSDNNNDFAKRVFSG